jgi:hypothetical protein
VPLYLYEAFHAPPKPSRPRRLQIWSTGHFVPRNIPADCERPAIGTPGLGGKSNAQLSYLPAFIFQAIIGKNKRPIL